MTRPGRDLPVDVVVTGDPRRRPVVLSPGLGMSAASWARVIDDLARDHAVITYDRPGLGRQGHVRPPAPPTLADEVHRLDVVVAAAQGTCAGPMLLVGHSMAGFWVEAWARLHPDLVRGLIFVDGSVEEDPAPLGPIATSTRSWLGRLAAAGPGALRRAGAALLEDAAYHRMAAELEAVRVRCPLPAARIVVLAATLTGRVPWERRWLRRRRAWAGRLGEEHPLGPGHVAFEIVRPSRHRVMRDAPSRICAAVRALDDPGPRW